MSQKNQQPKQTTESTTESGKNQETTTPTESYVDVAALAARIVEMGKRLDQERSERIKFVSDIRVEIARLKESVSGAQGRVDNFAEQWMAHRNEMSQARQEGGNQLLLAGKLARDMTDKMLVLEEIRKGTPDPRELLRPLRAEFGQIKQDLKALATAVDLRFEQMPKPRARPLEERGEGPSATPGRR